MFPGLVETNSAGCTNNVFPITGAPLRPLVWVFTPSQVQKAMDLRPSTSCLPICLTAMLHSRPSLNLAFSLALTTVTLSSQGVPSLRLPGWRPSSTMPAALSFVNVENPPQWLLIGNWVFPPWLPGENFTLLLPRSTVCPSSPLLIFLSFFLCLHPTTTLALLRLPSSTFHKIDLIWKLA